MLHIFCWSVPDPKFWFFEICNFQCLVKFQARKQSTNPNLWIWISSAGVGVFRVKGWGAKSLACPLKCRENKLRDIPGLPGGARKVWENQNIWPLKLSVDQQNYKCASWGNTFHKTRNNWPLGELIQQHFPRTCNSENFWRVFLRFLEFFIWLWFCQFRPVNLHISAVRMNYRGEAFSNLFFEVFGLGILLEAPYYGAQNDYTPFHYQELFSQLHRTSVAQSFLAGILLCNSGAFIRYFLWTRQLHVLIVSESIFQLRALLLHKRIVSEWFV